MKNLQINGQDFTFDKIVKFKESNNLFECFFFENEILITSKFLTSKQLQKLI